jgi:para-nitrobenzyl esterase
MMIDCHRDGGFRGAIKWKFANFLDFQAKRVILDAPTAGSAMRFAMRSTHMRTPGAICLGRPLAVTLLVLLVCPCVYAARVQDFLLGGEDVVRQTDAGPVRGTVRDGMQIFRSIPYAAPPVGANRFMAPGPVQPWKGIRDARHPGPACPQIQEIYDSSEDGAAIQSEDCLTLNVWEPPKAAAPLPVMVFIHGGSLVEGSAADSGYDGMELARRGSVVVVTLQYRLGVLGFLYLGGVGGETYARSGNSGILDQVAALGWIRRNIATFGGDPHNVTLFGESSGGASIRGLMVMPMARNLFNKVIIESGDTGPVIPAAQASQLTADFLRLTGVRGVGDLQKLPVEALLRAQYKLFADPSRHAVFGLTVDGLVFRESVIEGVKKDVAASVPMLIGTNAEETRYFMALDGIPLDQQSPDALRRALVTALELDPAGLAGEAQAIIDRYLASGVPQTVAFETLLSDVTFRIPSIRLAEVNSARQPTYFYSFAYRSPTRGPTGLEYGAMHGIELPFVFHDETPASLTYVGPQGTWTHIADQVVAAWSHFARTGDPGNLLLPTWPRYDTKDRAVMEFGPRALVLMDPLAAERVAWDRIPSQLFEAGLSQQLEDPLAN